MFAPLELFVRTYILRRYITFRAVFRAASVFLLAVLVCCLVLDIKQNQSIFIYRFFKNSAVLMAAV